MQEQEGCVSRFVGYTDSLSVNLFLKIESTLKLKLKPIKCLTTLKEVSQIIVYILLC